MRMQNNIILIDEYIMNRYVLYMLVVWLFGFHGLSSFVGYLMLNPFLYKKTVLFQTIQFNISTQFNCQKHFYFKLFSLVKQF